jgi:hypothetical protein
MSKNGPLTTDAMMKQIMAEAAEDPYSGRFIEKFVPSVKRPVEKWLAHTSLASPLASPHASPQKVVASPQERGRASPQKDRHKGRDPQLAIRLKPVHLEHLKELCEAYKMSQTEYVASHIEADWLAHNESSGLAHDDKRKNLMIDDNIIRAYCELTANVWKRADYRSRRLLNSADPRLVEIAMCEIFIRSRGRINSFNYFVPGIQDYIEQASETRMGEESIEIAHRRRWEQAREKLREGRK